jgi:hypothetical protein
VSRLRPDPLKRLHLDLGSEGRELVAASTSSVPEATRVQRARVDTAVRHVADEVSGGMTRPWVAAIRRASVSQGADFADTVDRVVGETPMGMGSVPAWCKVVRGLQWVLILAALAGAVWLGVLAVLGYLQVTKPAAPSYGGLPLPTLLLLGGVALGVVLALVSRLLVGLGAKARARSAEKRLRTAIATVTEKMILQPVDVELDAYRKAREGLQRALV